MKTGESSGQGNGQDQAAAAPAKRRTRADARQAVADLLTDAGGVEKIDREKPKGEEGATGRQGDADPGKGKGTGEAVESRSGDPGKEKAADSGAAGAGEAKAKPKTWKEAAERLGLDPEELYGLELELAANKGKATLGQLKDLLQTHGAELGPVSELIGTARKDSEAAREAREAAGAEANIIRRDLAGIIGAMGHVPPGVVQQVRQAQQKRLERELALTLDAAPEWRDPKVFTQDKAEISGILGKYGFSARELDAVDDSRLLLFLRDTLQRRRAAQSAIANAGETPGSVKHAASGPSSRGISQQATRGGMVARIAAAKAGGRESKISAVASLLSRKG